MTFSIAQTKTTPSAEFRDGCLVIKGKAVPFEYPDIYDIINDQLVVYSEVPSNHAQVDFYLSVVNAISKCYIYNIFKLLEKLDQKGTKISVNWFYQKDNEDIQELGEICKSKFHINVQLLETY
jgi:glutathione peroxidase-family protein